MNARGMLEVFHTERGGAELGFYVSDRQGMVIEIEDHGLRFPYDEAYLNKETASSLIIALHIALEGGRGEAELLHGRKASIYRVGDSKQFRFWLASSDGPRISIPLRPEEMDILLNKKLIPFWS